MSLADAILRGLVQGGDGFQPISRGFGSANGRGRLAGLKLGNLLQPHPLLSF
jgi:hypothetical protein